MKRFLKPSTPLCILHNLFKRDYNKVDRISRSIAYNAFIRYTSRLSEEALWRIIDEITGGLGYEKDNIDESRIIQLGCHIAWPEVVKDNSRILEIGTGLGRTLYCVFASINPREYITIDISPLILSIALYRNPFRYFQEKLWLSQVKIVLLDAIKAVEIMVYNHEKFDHIIHDGGPNPRRNPYLFSKDFLKNLVKLLNTNGTISVFAGKDRSYIDKIYRLFKSMKMDVETRSYPGIPVRVVKARKLDKTL